MRRAGGFTVVELMITVAVVALLAVLAVPTLRSVIENGRIRAASEGMKYGLALARAEAVRRNTPVDFSMDADGWQVRVVSNGTVLQRASGNEGTEGLNLDVQPAGATTVTFDNFGRVLDPNPDGSDRITQVDVDAASVPGSGDYHPLRVQVLAGGMARLCDPALSSSDPRACL